MTLLEFSAKSPKTILLATFVFAASLAQAQTTVPTPVPTPVPIPVPTPAPAVTWDKNIKAIITDNCTYCHSGTAPTGDLTLETEAQVLKVKATIITVVSKGLMPDGDPTWKDTADGKTLLAWLKAQDTTPPPAPVVTWVKDIQPLVVDNCQYCHTKGSAEKGIILDTEADVVKNKAEIIKQVSAGNMPYGDPTWKTTADGKLFLDWLKALPVKPAS